MSQPQRHDAGLASGGGAEPHGAAQDRGGHHGHRGDTHRHFAVSVFVGWQGRLLLHRHAKLRRWLPCGGHIEPNELPDDAAVREVLEEAGVQVRLTGEKTLSVAGDGLPVQLVRPRGVQLEVISPGHEHIDLIYFAVPQEPYDGGLAGSEEGLGWYSPTETGALGLDAEMRAWTELAFAELG